MGIKFQIHHLDDNDMLFIWGVKEVKGIDPLLTYDFEIKLAHTSAKTVIFMFNIKVSDKEQRQIRFEIDYNKNEKTLQAMMSDCGILFIEADYPGDDCDFKKAVEVTQTCSGMSIKIPQSTIQELVAFKSIFNSNDKPVH